MSREHLDRFVEGLRAHAVPFELSLWDARSFAAAPGTVVRAVDMATFGPGKVIDHNARSEAFAGLAEALADMGARAERPNPIKRLSPPAHDEVRLWRIERHLVRLETFDAERLDVNAIPSGRGQWFTNSVDVAMQYAQAPAVAAAGRLFYIDVHRTVAQRGLLQNQPDTVRRLARPDALEDEIFLDASIASEAILAPDTVESHSLLPGQAPLIQGVFVSGASIIRLQTGDAQPWLTFVEWARSPFLNDSVPLDLGPFHVPFVRDRENLSVLFRIPVAASQWVQLRIGVNPLDDDLTATRYQRVMADPIFMPLTAMLKHLRAPSGRPVWVLTGDWASALQGQASGTPDLKTLKAILTPREADLGIAARWIAAQMPDGPSWEKTLAELSVPGAEVTVESLDGIKIQFRTAGHQEWDRLMSRALMTEMGEAPLYLDTDASIGIASSAGILLAGA